MQEAHAHLFAGIAVLVTPAEVAQMQAVIAAVERVVALPAWQGQHRGDTPFEPANPGVFFGYDFHLNAEGAHLIEINTNAGGAFVNDLLLRSQRDVALPGKALADDDLEHSIVAMFRHEWRLQCGAEPLRSIAIVDVAVRRRFGFVSLWPQMSVVVVNSCELMQQAFRDLVSIFIEHASEDAFNLVPGHSYFLERDVDKARTKLRINLAPLLDEYLAQGYVGGFAEPIRSYLQWIRSL